MSALKEIVQNSLRTKQVGPNVISEVEPLIRRSIVRLQNNDLLPPRTFKFTSLDKKEEVRENDEVLYNFYYLPDDFRKLSEFKPHETYPYILHGNLTQMLKQSGSQKYFTIENVDFNGKYENILVATPFPKDDETVEIRYYVNGHNMNWDWISEDYWEAIISDVENMLGLASPQEVEDRIGDTVSRWKEPQGHNTNNKAYRTLKGKFFGNRR